MKVMHNTSHREKGFTLIEILIALAIMSIVTTAIYQLFISQQKTWVSQDLLTEMQQNSRVSIDTISRDLLMAGYGVTTAVEDGNANRVAIRYMESNGDKKRIAFWLDGSTSTLKRIKETLTSEGPPASPGLAWDHGDPLADNAVSLDFTYFDKFGNKLTVMPPNSPYRIKVSLKVRTSRKDPVTLDWKYLTLSTDIRPRNIGIGGAASDETPPEVPDPAPTLTDPHICGKLNVSWSAVPNAGADLAGYVIYIGPAAGAYTQKVSVGDVTSYTLTGLDNAAPYYIAIASRDKSGNESDYSDAATATPVADEPGQPVGLDATEASTTDTGNPWVKLAWTLNSTTYSTSAAHAPAGTGPDTDVTRYEIDRAVHGTGSWSNIGNSTTSTFTDNTLDESNKCTTYDYRVRAVTVCSSTTLNSAYSSTVYGDGSVSGGITDVPNDGATNTTPRDSTPPDAPTGPGGGTNPVLSKAGYKRVFLTWDNPANISNNKDLDHISIRYNEDTDNPASVIDGTAVENGVGGIFDTTNMGSSFGAGSTSVSYTHYGVLGCDTSPACLTVDATYYYSLFAVDRCGNISDASESAETAIDQCGEDTTAPTYGAPPKVANFNVSACTSPYNFTWDRTSDAHPADIYDFVGYYLYKSTTGSFNYNDTDTKLNSDVFINPPDSMTTVTKSDLASSYDYADDDPAYAGNTYMYYVMGIDCVRENNTDLSVASNPWSTVPVQPKSPSGSPAPAYSPDVITVKPGRVTFGNNTSVTTGYLTAASPFTEPNYYHNTADVKLKNTSAGSVKLKNMRVSWVNTAAYLKTIYKKNTDGTWTSVWTSASPVASGTTVTFSTALGVEGVGDVVNNPWTLRFLFSASDGTVTQSQDMREDTVTVTNIEYDKIFTKGITEITPTCTYTTPETVNVPNGPVVSGTSQYRSSSDIVVSSISPGYWTVGATMDVNVFTWVSDTSAVGISSVKLYYKATDRTVTDYTTVLNYSDISSWSVKDMLNIGGTQYAIYNPTTTAGSKITAQADKRIWYFIISTDNKGNFDMEPERGSGAFVYDHESASPCAVTPSNPTVLLGTVSGANVNLEWTPSTTYTNTNDKYSTDEFKYRIYRDENFSGTWTQIDEVSCSTDPCTYTDNTIPAGQLNTKTWSYRVKTINKCFDSVPACIGYSPWPAAPPSCLSTVSNTYTECSGGASISISPGASSILPGGSFDLTAFVCDLASNATTDRISVHNTTVAYDDDDFCMVETGPATGQFTIEGALYSGQTTITTSGTGMCTPNMVCLYVNPVGDTITFDNVRYDLADPTTCSTAKTSHSATYAQVSVLGDECSRTPAAPTGMAISGTPNCNSNNVSVTLTWTASADTDVDGYQVYETGTGSEVLFCSSNSRTTTTCNASISGKLNARCYAWVVKAKNATRTSDGAACSPVKYSPASTSVSTTSCHTCP